LDSRGGISRRPGRPALVRARAHTDGNRGRPGAAAQARHRRGSRLPAHRRTFARAAGAREMTPRPGSRRQWLAWMGTPLLLSGLLAAWNLATLSPDVSPFILPPPEDVLNAFRRLLRRPEVWTVHARVTFLEAVSGFGFALLGGVAVGNV